MKVLLDDSQMSATHFILLRVVRLYGLRLRATPGRLPAANENLAARLADPNRNWSILTLFLTCMDVNLTAGYIQLHNSRKGIHGRLGR